MLVPLLGAEALIHANAKLALDELGPSATTTLLNTLADTDLGGWAAVELGEPNRDAWEELGNLLRKSAIEEERANAAYAFLHAAAKGTVEDEQLLQLAEVVENDVSGRVRGFLRRSSGATSALIVRSLFPRW